MTSLPMNDVTERKYATMEFEGKDTKDTTKQFEERTQENVGGRIHVMNLNVLHTNFEQLK